MKSTARCALSSFLVFAVSLAGCGGSTAQTGGPDAASAGTQTPASDGGEDAAGDSDTGGGNALDSGGSGDCVRQLGESCQAAKPPTCHCAAGLLCKVDGPTPPGLGTCVADEPDAAAGVDAGMSTNPADYCRTDDQCDGGLCSVGHRADCLAPPGFPPVCFGRCFAP
jgi:hypothetical protein